MTKLEKAKVKVDAGVVPVTRLFSAPPRASRKERRFTVDVEHHERGWINVGYIDQADVIVREDGAHGLVVAWEDHWDDGGQAYVGNRCYVQQPVTLRVVDHQTEFTVEARCQVLSRTTLPSSNQLYEFDADIISAEGGKAEAASSVPMARQSIDAATFNQIKELADGPAQIAGGSHGQVAGPNQRSRSSIHQDGCRRERPALGSGYLRGRDRDGDEGDGNKSSS